MRPLGSFCHGRFSGLTLERWIYRFYFGYVYFILLFLVNLVLMGQITRVVNQLLDLLFTFMLLKGWLLACTNTKLLIRGYNSALYHGHSDLGKYITLHYQGTTSDCIPLLK